jgi:hypothetical protein
MSETVAGITVPRTTVTTEAADLVRQTASPAIFHHAHRVFLLGALRARALGIEPDPELLYLAALFHDTGFVSPHRGAGSRAEIDSARQARTFLLAHDRSVGDADTVWAAVALQTAPATSRRTAPVTTATAAGVEADVLGVHLKRLEAHERDEIVAAHPRSDFEREVEGVLVGRPGSAVDVGALHAGVLARLAPGRRATAPGAVRSPSVRTRC